MIHAQRLPNAESTAPVRDPEILEAYLEDASGSPAGTASGVVRVASEADAAGLLRSTLEQRQTILVQAARSSLTGGAIPRGELVLSIENMRERGPISRHGGGGRVTVQPGMRLSDLQLSLSESGLYFPPVPTYQQAMLGGTVATNAGGAASFKYGVTRQWVHGIRVLLYNGDLLTLERGQYAAKRGDVFRIGLSDGSRLQVPVPDYRLPDLKKITAGYYAADPLDLVDLFIGSEGTLGLITAITINVIPAPAAVVTGLVFMSDPRLAHLLASAMRDAAMKSRDESDSAGPDVRSIEWIDAESLEILRRTEQGRRLRIEIPVDAKAALLFEMELPEAMSNADVEEQLGDFMERGGSGDRPLIRLFRILEDHQALESLEFAFPEDERRQQALVELREAVPAQVNEILSRRRGADPAVQKIAGDMIVPYSELSAMIDCYVEGYQRRGLEYAIWGHLSDGNLHPNALPKDAAQTHAATELLYEFAAEVTRRGGAPLSEHGVGRSAIKQELMRRFLGDAAIESMRAIKQALDPPCRFAPGVLFPA